MTKFARADIVRLLICCDEVGNLPPGSQSLRVQSGHAWVSAAGGDHVLGPGATLRLPASHDPALISALRHCAVIVEVEVGERPGWQTGAPHLTAPVASLRNGFQTADPNCLRARQIC